MIQRYLDDILHRARNMDGHHTAANAHAAAGQVPACHIDHQFISFDPVRRVLYGIDRRDLFLHQPESVRKFHALPPSCIDDDIGPEAFLPLGRFSAKDLLSLSVFTLP